MGSRGRRKSQGVYMVVVVLVEDARDGDSYVDVLFEVVWRRVRDTDLVGADGGTRGGSSGSGGVGVGGIVELHGVHVCVSVVGGGGITKRICEWMNC